MSFFSQADNVILFIVRFSVSPSPQIKSWGEGIFDGTLSFESSCFYLCNIVELFCSLMTVVSLLFLFILSWISCPFRTCLIIIDHYCYCEVCSSCWLETWSLMFPGSQHRPGAADSPVCVFLSQKLTNGSALIREPHFHSCCVATESRRSRPLGKELHSGKWQKIEKPT